MEIHQSYGPTLFSHNRNYLMRAYPSGLRVSSSNLDPSVFWRKGVQMVALNWQRWDQGMMLNEGMFAGEGGWVLKPKGYRSINQRRGDAAISDESQGDAIAHNTLDLAIEVYAGQAIPLPIDDESVRGFHPYVKCELHVEKAEERTGAPIEGGGKSKDGEHKRRTKTRKGIEPDFGGESLEWVGIPYVVEELSFLRFATPVIPFKLPSPMRCAVVLHQPANPWSCFLRALRPAITFDSAPSMSGPRRTADSRSSVAKTAALSCDASHAIR